MARKRPREAIVAGRSSQRVRGVDEKYRVLGGSVVMYVHIYMYIYIHSFLESVNGRGWGKGTR